MGVWGWVEMYASLPALAGALYVWMDAEVWYTFLLFIAKSDRGALLLLWHLMNLIAGNVACCAIISRSFGLARIHGALPCPARTPHHHCSTPTYPDLLPCLSLYIPLCRPSADVFQT